MKKESQNLPQTPHLNIEKLMRTLEALTKETNRISRARLDEIFRALRFELPYSTSIINAGLAFALFADAPRGGADTTLNEVVIYLSKTLINPTQTAALNQAVQIYYQDRKKTESEYAGETVLTVLATNPLDAFPEASWDDMRELALTVMEKIVSEKLARRIPGYKSQSVLELIYPFLHFRLVNTNLEKIKLTQPQVFKKWLTNLAHDGYEKINNEKKFTLIQQEKDYAFATFKMYLTSRSQNKANIARWIEKISFSQKDKNKKIDLLSNSLSEFLADKSIIADSVGLLHTRFYDNLRRLFAAAEKNPALYQEESSITAAQNKAYTQIKNDLSTVEKILDIFNELDKNYSKNLMASWLGRANINQVKTLLVTGLLGSVVKKRDLQSGNYLMVHDGGYPQKTLSDIISSLMTNLQKLADQATGMFSSALKIQIGQAIHQLTALSSNLTPAEDFSAPMLAAEVSTPPPAARVTPVTHRIEIPLETPSVERTFGPTPKSRFEIPEPAVKSVPVIEPVPLEPEREEETSATPASTAVEEVSATPTFSAPIDEPTEAPTLSEPDNELAENSTSPEPSFESGVMQSAPEPIEPSTTPAPTNEFAATSSEPSYDSAVTQSAPAPIEPSTTPAPTNEFVATSPEPSYDSAVTQSAPAPIEPSTTSAPTNEFVATGSTPSYDSTVTQSVPELIKPSIAPASSNESASTPTHEPTATQEPVATSITPEPSNDFAATLAASATTPTESAPLLDPEFGFDDDDIPTIQFEPVTFETPAPAAAVNDPGLAIMGNYDLGDFKEPVHEAWKTMLVQAVSARPDEDINSIAAEQAVNFYVICALVQQVAGINEDMLSPDNKEMLISIQTLLLAALKDPLEENNWTFFEGSRRNDVDRAIAVLKS